MQAPTLYKLIFKKNSIGEFDVYEQHKCQELGCVWTDENYTGNVVLPGHIDQFIEDYEHDLLEGIVDEVEVIG